MFLFKFKFHRNVKWPNMWQRNGPQGHHHYNLRLLFDIVPMNWSCPVIVNYHEAEAYSTWLGLSSPSKKPMRVLTELEHRAIRDDDLSYSSSNDDHSIRFSGNEMMFKVGESFFYLYFRFDYLK
jgi:hypothetical protein